jgi:hypothetical protein
LNAPLFESRRPWHFLYLQSKLESSFPIWHCADHGSAFAKYCGVVGAGEKAFPRLRVNPQYSPNVSGKSKKKGKKLSETDSSLGKRMHMLMTRAVS